MVDKKDTKELRELNVLLEKIHRQYDIQPIVLLTKIDKAFANNVFETSQVFEYGISHSYINKLAKLLPTISASQIYPHVNFTGYKDFPDEWVSSL